MLKFYFITEMKSLKLSKNNTIYRYWVQLICEIITKSLKLSIKKPLFYKKYPLPFFLFVFCRFIFDGLYQLNEINRTKLLSCEVYCF